MNVTYPMMITRLFKVEGMHQQHEALMHAAIGIAGEVGELLDAIHNDDEENQVEELGDSEFYQEAMWQALGLSIEEPDESFAMTHCNNYDFGNGLIVSGCDLLDLAKKCWVYGKDPDIGMLTHKLKMYRVYHLRAIGICGLDVSEIRARNMDKLIGPNGRFRGMVYSDQAAQERADKVE